MKSMIFNFLVSIRNPSLFRFYNELITTDFSSREELDSIQAKKLSKLLNWAVDHSLYWQEIISSYVSNTELISKDPMSALSCLPISYKSDYVKNTESISVNSSLFYKTFLAETSGSTGEPLKFYKNEEWDSFNRASIARGMSWYDVSIDERNGYLWGFDFHFSSKIKIMFLDFLQNRFRLFGYEKNSLARFLKKSKKAKYLHGYSSVLNQISLYCIQEGIRLPNIKVVKGTSEKIFPSYVKNCLKAFSVPMVSEYGSAESGIIAFECPEGNMHINEENVIVEVIDGEIVVTNLNSLSFPFFRYALGDYVELSNILCSCGRSHKVIDSVTGRVGKNIYGINNIKFPSLTLYYICKNLALRNFFFSYRAVQNIVGEVDFYVKYDGDVEGDKLVLLIRSEAKSYFHDNLKLNIFMSDELYSSRSKLKDFESNLNDNR